MKRLCTTGIVGILLILNAWQCDAQTSSPQEQSSATPTPTATPVVFSPQTLAELKRLQQAALSSDYAYRQVAHLADNIGPRLTGSVQAAKAVEYVAGELKAIGCEVQLENVMVPHWVGGEAYGEAVVYRGDGPSAAARQGAVACLIRSVGGADYRIPHTGKPNMPMTRRKFRQGRLQPRTPI